MTKIQFEMLTVYYGMLHDGCSKEQAFGYVAIMGYGQKDLAWLAQKLQKSA